MSSFCDVDINFSVCTSGHNEVMKKHKWVLCWIWVLRKHYYWSFEQQKNFLYSGCYYQFSQIATGFKNLVSFLQSNYKKLHFCNFSYSILIFYKQHTFSKKSFVSGTICIIESLYRQNESILSGWKISYSNAL